MNVLALTKYARLGASSRLRTYQYADANELSRVNWHVVPLLDDKYIEALYKKKRIGVIYLLQRYFSRFLILFHAISYDVVWIEKELFPGLPAWAEQILAFLGVRYIVDYDDAIFHNYDQSKSLTKRVLRKKIDTVMRCSALVTAGNKYLADRAISAGAQWVEIFPTVIDLNRYPIIDITNTSSILTIGWIGSPSTVKYLNLVLPVLDKLEAKINFQFVVIGAEIEAPERKYLRCIQWEEKTEVESILAFDIGVMPLLDAPFERGKCGYKLIQYMACSKAVIASPVGVNCELVRDGLNGFLAVDEVQWEQAIIALASDRVLCLNMGKEGRKLVEKMYSLQRTAPRLEVFFDKVGEN
ncbi:glycosyltransferase family 4 protein [Aeromonas sp. QDB12]|uniref:glycosyltransferase family 4 protein n=1 Tax=Aeromonas sp. QDB12 TaxID=2990483 RepID=UPI0022E8C7A9|nr:glycosyltransferase family 4 protein [Aeromonas sp. QDB12]